VVPVTQTVPGSGAKVEERSMAAASVKAKTGRQILFPLSGPLCCAEN
jgi:hypothetical protein